MDTLHKILTGIIIFVALGCAYLGYQWMQAHEAQIKAEAKSEANAAAAAQIAEQQKVFQEQIIQLRKDTADALANNSKQFNQAQSPQQLAILIAQIMGLKQAPVVVTPAATPENPHPQPVIQLPDTPQAKAYFQECEECKINLASATKAAAIADANAKLSDDRLKLMTDDRNTWKDAAKGGSWKVRAAKRAESFLVDIGIAAAIYCGSGHCTKK